MMTLKQLSDRLNAIIASNPKNANKPVYMRAKRTSRTTEHIPISR